MNRIAIAFALLCALSPTFAFNFEDCGSEVGKFGDVIISSCSPSDEKCLMNRGTDITLSMKFTPNKDVSKVEARAFGVLLDVPIPFPLKNADVCKDSNSGITCPLKGDQEVEYKSTFAIDKATPSLSLEIIWQFVNEDDQKILCVKFPAKIK